MKTPPPPPPPRSTTTAQPPPPPPLPPCARKGKTRFPAHVMVGTGVATGPQAPPLHNHHDHHHHYHLVPEKGKLGSLPTSWYGRGWQPGLKHHHCTTTTTTATLCPKRENSVPRPRHGRDGGGNRATSTTTAQPPRPPPPLPPCARKGKTRFPAHVLVRFKPRHGQKTCLHGTGTGI